MSQFSTQDGIRGGAFQNGYDQTRVDYSKDNLFTGVWNLDQNNLDRFDPFVTGYGAIIWTKLPAFFERLDKGKYKDFTSQFKAMTERNFKSFSGLSDLSLDTEALSHGFAGNELNTATNIKKENTTFTLKHYELAGSPIREMYQVWVTGIRDPETGLATYHGAIKDGMRYSMKNHTGELLYVVTDPSFAVGGAMGIEFACYYTNVFPTKVFLDHLNYSSGDHAVQELDQEFRGNFHMSTEINKLAVTAMKSYTIEKTYGDYDGRSADTRVSAYQQSTNIEQGYNE